MTEPKVYEKIQKTPSIDSPSTDAFEAIVSAYYQNLGYITSVSKWFWVWDNGKKQRGYQDIDVLAISATETIIVSVTSSLDDKIRFQKVANERVIHDDLFKKQLEFFNRVKHYLAGVDQYKWLVEAPRQVRFVIAFSSGEKLAADLQAYDGWGSHNIELIYVENMLSELEQIFVSDDEKTRVSLKTNNPIIRLFQIMSDVKRQKPRPKKNP